MSKHPEPQPAHFHDGFLIFRGHRIWHRVYGAGEEAGQLPLLALPAGPGMPCDYLEPLSALATGRRVILYDPLGSGRSDHPYNPELWSVDLFLEELSVVRRTLGINELHLLGHAWGGMLALEHTLSGAPGLASLILLSTPPSVPAWLSEVEELIAGLPMGARLALTQSIVQRRTDVPGYAEAAALFDRRHGCRLDPLPVPLRRSRESAQRYPDVKQALWGSHPFVPDGPLAAWDATPRLDTINLPTLVLGGRHDETPPHCTGALHRAIPFSEYALFEQSAHHPHLEEPEAFYATVADFLERVEAYL